MDGDAYFMDFNEADFDKITGETLGDDNKYTRMIYNKLLNDETIVQTISDELTCDIVHSTDDNLCSDTIKELIESMWDKDEIRSGEILSGLLWDTISYNDYHEDYYHAFLAGLFVGRGYEVESNKEKGLGRPDILLTDRKKRRAIIVESKKSKKKADLDKDCDKALKQIVDEIWSIFKQDRKYKAFHYN